MVAWYGALLLLLGAERLLELALSKKNAAWAFERGGIEYGRRHFGLMKVLHVGFFAGSASEVFFLERPFVPRLGIPMLALVLLAQGLRYWAVISLGKHWNLRVIVVPGVPAVTRGPYRLMRHPNYLAVILEGFAVPLSHGAWITAVVFSALNAWMLRVRIRCEERALAAHAEYVERLGDRRRFVPRAALTR